MSYTTSVIAKLLLYFIKIRAVKALILLMH